VSGAIALVLALLSSGQVKTSTLSEDEEASGALLVKNDCLACHSSEMLMQQRLLPAQWDAVVQKMRRWGAPTEQADVPLLLRYLSAKYRADLPRYRPERVNAKKTLAAMAPLPDGRWKQGSVKNGAELYDRACAPCHAPDGKGGSFGVALTGRKVLTRAEDFASAVKNGFGRMPQFGDLTDKEIASILAYARTLKD
jgi:mono/diheme cytochrome c family protein